MPTLYVNGQPVLPVHAQIYYRRKTMTHVEAFPPGFRVVAGDAKAIAPQGRRVTFWNCGALTGDPAARAPCPPAPTRAAARCGCTSPSRAAGTVRTSTAPTTGATSPTRSARRCPSTHPHALPQISLIYRYPTTGGPGTTLASGGQFSGHADFFNAWNQTELQRLVDACLNALRHCGRS